MSMDGGFRIKYPAGYALKNGKLPVGVRHHNQYLMDKKAIAAEEYSHLPKKEAYKMAAARIRAQRAKPASPWNILVSKEIKRLQPLRDEVGHKEIFAEAVENAKVEYHKGKVPHKIQKPNMALLPRFKVPHKIQKPNMALLPRLKKK